MFVSSSMIFASRLPTDICRVIAEFVGDPEEYEEVMVDLSSAGLACVSILTMWVSTLVVFLLTR